MVSSGIDKDGNRIYKQYTHSMKNNILYFNRVSNKHTVHPTQKPVALLEYLIKTYTNENEVVLDNCMGSGSTGVACINTNRSFIGIELDPKYFEIAKERIEKQLRNN
jgi:site-specific DNA-methyltransferase (adenine-specific)